jgi:hypothetical protein
LSVQELIGLGDGGRTTADNIAGHTASFRVSIGIGEASPAIIVAQPQGTATTLSKANPQRFHCLALSGKISKMSADDQLTQELVRDLTKVARNGIGRALPRKQGSQHIPHLWAAAIELVDDQAKDVPALVASVVVPAVRQIEPPGDQEAVAEILWIDLAAADGYRRGEAPLLGGHGNRYDRAAAKLGSTELDVKNNLRQGLLEKVAKLIVARLKTRRAGMDVSRSISEPDYAFNEGEPSLPLVQALAWKAIELHYSTLVPLFIYDFSQIIPREDNFGRENLYPNAYIVWRNCSERIFRSYIAWLATYRWLQDTRAAAKELQGLSVSSRRKLKVLCDACDIGPPGVRGLDMDSLGNLFTDAIDDVRLDDSPLYIEHWLPWYEAEIEYPDPENNRAIEERAGIEVPEKSHPHNLNVIAAKSVQIFRVVSAEMALMLPFDTLGRDLAYKHIAACYIFDEWAPIHQQKSLREHATFYVIRKQAELDN